MPMDIGNTLLCNLTSLLYLLEKKPSCEGRIFCMVVPNSNCILHTQKPSAAFHHLHRHRKQFLNQNVNLSKSSSLKSKVCGVLVISPIMLQIGYESIYQ
jgi:flagellar assembly factor FliW